MSLPGRILVASDLHLNAGRDRYTGAFDPRENFTADEAFSRWLAYFRAVASPGAPGTLVLAGDTFDFIRLDVVPSKQVDYEVWANVLDELGEGPTADRLRRLAPLTEEERSVRYDSVVSKKEKRFGFGTEDYKAVWKLIVIDWGHHRFFVALADWVQAGGTVVFIKGNHDLELHWPLMQRAIHRLVAPGPSAGRVQFRENHWKEYNVFVEHGHRWEAMTAVHTDTPTLPHRPDLISLPMGSFINRYLINGIERLDPFIDNVKPINSALGALIRRYPLTILRMWARGVRFLKRILRVKGFFASLGAALQVVLLILLPPVVIGVALWFVADRVIPGLQGGALIGTIAGLAAGTLVVGGLSIRTVLPIVVSIAGDFKRMIGLRKRDELAEAAEKISRYEFGEPGLTPTYVVMGHTHRPKMVTLGSESQFYANSGTWTPIWRQDRIDLAGQVVFSFVEFDWHDQLGAYLGGSMRWNDEAFEPQPAVIYADLEK